MFLFQIFLHQEVKRNQNITKRPLFGAPCRNSTCQLTLSLRKTHISVFPDYFSFRHFLACSSYFQTLRLSSLSSLPVVYFLKQCVILFNERSSDRSFIFLLNWLLKEEQLEPSILSSRVTFFTGTVAAIHSFRGFLEMTIFDSSYL